MADRLWLAGQGPRQGSAAGLGRTEYAAVALGVDGPVSAGDRDRRQE